MKFDLGPTSCFAVNKKENTEKPQRLHPSATQVARGQEHVTYDEGPVHLMAASHCSKGSCEAKPSLAGSGAVATSWDLGGFRQDVRVGSCGRGTQRWCSLHSWRLPHSSR